ncbi:MAG TPA: BamA/TamA family outer membrane protein [Usitatibacter sp.]|nr:BamA/TamA family outer membrane protein [Usitatibacter sp.]
MKALAILLLACASAGALAQSPPPQSEQTTGAQGQRDREADRERARDVERRAGRGPRTFTVTWKAPDPLRGLFEKFLPPPKAEESERRPGYVRPWIRDVRRRVPEIAASEGYFSATVDFDFEDDDREHITVTVTPGPRTTVGEVSITFAGDLAGEGAEREARREALRRGWTLKPGAPFRSGDWDVAKTRLHEALTEEDYAAGALAKTEALVDADAAKASLAIELDSGPPFTLGDVLVEGLEEYPEAVVRRIVDLKRGERYSMKKLLDLQRAIQAGPWFASVIVEVERDRAKPEAVPVKVLVTERPRREVGVSVGYGTDDGARAEAAFRHRDLFERGFDLQSSIRAGQKRQIGFADVYLPYGIFGTSRRGDVPFRDSFGVLAEHSTIERLALSRFAVAGYRHFKLETWETRVGLSYQIERSFPEGTEPRIKRALAPIAAVTWRRVDDLFDPRRGGVLNLQVAAGAKSVASGQDFLKVYGQYQHWIPITPRDQVILRGELGTTFAASREGIPEDFLFRAGGSRSNRGYAFQGLGPQEGNAVVGGRYLATATAEYVHWLNDQWGAAVFTDVGDAADTRGEWKGNPSYGVGARFKTPAGPFALDLAYAQDPRKFRLSFSVTVAF